jgi:ABC-type multidrug transport system fused ATPase/permease subunit
MKKKGSFFKILKPYTAKLLAVSFFNFLSVTVAIITFLLIEPFVKLLFQGNVENVSVVSRYFIKILNPFIDITSLASSISALALIIILLFLIKNLFTAVSLFLMAPVKSSIIKNLRDQIYYRILILPISFFTSGKRGDVISRAVNDTQEVEFTILKSVQTFLTNPFTILNPETLSST